MNLIYDKNSATVRPGDIVTLDDDQFEIESIEKPRTPASTGRVYLRRVGTDSVQGFFPSVIGASWDERPDREDEGGHNSKEANEAFRQTWDETNARYRALCKDIEEEKP